MSDISATKSRVLDAIAAASRITDQAQRREGYDLALDALISAATTAAANAEAEARRGGEIETWPHDGGADWTNAVRAVTPTPWLVTDWLPAGRLSVLTGTGGRGKSRLALQLAAAVAAGDSAWLAAPDGAPVPPVEPHSPATAILASWEDHLADIARGLRAIDAPVTRIGHRLRYHDLSRAGPIWDDGGLTGAGADVLDDAAQRGARLLVIDPSAAAFGGDENRREDVRAFCSYLDGWSYATNCATLLIQHPPKSGAVYSGSTDWLAAARALISIGVENIAHNDGWDGVVLRLVKSNYSRSGVRIMLAREAGPYGGRWIATALPATCHRSYDVGPIPTDPVEATLPLGDEGLA